jgi:hypothetical protein
VGDTAAKRTAEQTIIYYLISWKLSNLDFHFTSPRFVHLDQDEINTIMTNVYLWRNPPSTHGSNFCSSARLVQQWENEAGSCRATLVTLLSDDYSIHTDIGQSDGWI